MSKLVGVLILNCGEVAHIGAGNISEPLFGHDMIDIDANTLPPGYGILTQDSRIYCIKDSESLQSEFAPWWDGSNNELDGIRVVDAAGRAIIPGLVDSHTHLLWGGDRSSELRLRPAGMP